MLNVPSKCCPTTPSWKSCARRESISPGERSQNIARRCELPRPCSAGERNRHPSARPPDALSSMILYRGLFCGELGFAGKRANLHALRNGFVHAAGTSVIGG